MPTIQAAAGFGTATHLGLRGATGLMKQPTHQKRKTKLKTPSKKLKFLGDAASKKHSCQKKSNPNTDRPVNDINSIQRLRLMERTWFAVWAFKLSNFPGKTGEINRSVPRGNSKLAHKQTHRRSAYHNKLVHTLDTHNPAH